jgi:hypothetical protein
MVEDGPRYVGTDTAALAWRVGPPGSPAVRGIDILTIRDGRVSVLRTLIAAETMRDQPRLSPWSCQIQVKASGC